MKGKLQELRRPLEIKDIDFRVQSINNGGYATILAYKDARVDMNRLDEVLGPGYWQRDVKLINGVLYGGVGIWNHELQEWVWKWDAGTESNTEKEKGQSSDAFKRACFNVGIGRELYDYPLIQVKLSPNEIQEKGGKKYASWDFKLKEWRWMSQFTDGILTFLAAKDQNGKLRFKWGEFNADKGESPDEQKASGSAVVDPHAHLAEGEQKSPTTIAEESNPQGVLKKKAEPTAEQEPDTSNEDDERDLLVAEYEKLFGRKPHGKASIETIQVKIDEYLSEHGDGSDKEEEDPYAAKVIIDNTVEIEEEEDFGMYDGPLSQHASEIDSFSDRESLKNWAIPIVRQYSEDSDCPSEHLKEFKDAVNSKYEKLS